MRKTYESTKKVYILIGIALILSVFFTSVIFGQSNLKSEAIKTAEISSATAVGGGVELWNASDNELNSDVATDLVDKIFGNNDAEEYLEAEGVEFFGSKVLQASKINANIVNDNGTIGNNYGLVVKLGGLTWMIASVTKSLPTPEEDEGILICTLYLATAQSTSAWGTRGTTIGYNAYCTSNLRYTLVQDATTASTWGLFRATGSDDGFAERYLVQPKYIAYQHTQNDTELAIENNTYSNEALGTPTNAKWNNAGSYSSGGSWAYNKWSSVGTQAYDAWGGDYIWLPSVTEVGWYNFNVNATSIWDLNNNQRTSNVVAWLRSGRSNGYYASYTVGADGEFGLYNVDASYGLRPALHLNLTSLLGSGVPEDTEVTYTGSDLDIATAVSVAGAKWYTKKLANAVDNGLVKITYTSGSLTDGVPKNVGSYGISFTIQTDKAWPDGQTPLFIWKGDDIKNPTITEKTMTLTIKPKELTATWSFNQENDTEPNVTFSGFVEGEDVSKLTITRKYTGRLATSDPSDTSQMPLKIGDYTVTITDIGNTNYTLVSGDSYDFHMESIKVALPTIKRSDETDYVAASTYTNWYVYEGQGVNKTYNLSYNTGQIRVTDWGGLSQYMNSLTTVRASLAGTYTIKMELTDKDNMVWADTKGTEDRSIDLKIKPMEMILEVYGTNNGVLTGSINENMTVTFDLPFNYRPKGDDTVSVYIQAIYTEDSNVKLPLTDPFTITSNGVGGKEVFTLELATGLIDDATDWKLEFVVTANSNYEFKTKEEVTLHMVALSSDGFITWRLNIDGLYAEGQQITVEKDSTTPADYTDKLTYDGREYSFKLNSSMPSGWKIDTSYNDDGYVNGYKNQAATDAGDYETFVRIIDTSNDNEVHVFSVKWNIKKALLDLSNVRWTDA